ncbi:MAG: class I SAM-dependent rRNA methyltransferase [Eubacteriales bacterium]|nr:class I SAM-dependent rRNA methyltransferase [Christensenellaceae bacterium]MDD7092703.1 class I SAM-dependent rRNA methyltransferase [Christensenellaceae bacterium]MDY3241424.1 class I SAM-dependent rRNA methyltransferase [Eubacteriales bacterium]
MYEIYLKKNEEKRIIAGHPWVYANEVARIEGKDKNGALVSVFSNDGKFIGKGYINHLSKILVRIFIRDDKTDDESFYKERIRRADDYRKSLGFENAYRMVFAESDDLPALIIDKYDDVFVMECLSYGISQRKNLIVKCLVDLFNPRGVYEKSESQVLKKEGLPDTSGVLYGEVPENIIINENGIKMSVDVRNGQKTGYFLDQKENRFAIRRYAKDKAVLDCFCNSGGFSMNAAAVARKVTAVDISETAVKKVEENARLNGFTNVEAVKADVFSFLREARSRNEKYGLVILDPPAFTKSASEISDAYRGYKDINILGMKLTESGGFLVTSSCSQHMTLPLFKKMLAESARESGKRVRIVEIKTQSPDHPSLLSADETVYLKFFVLQIL